MDKHGGDENPSAPWGRDVQTAHDAIAASSSDPFYREKLTSSLCYTGYILPKSASLRITVESNNSLLLRLPDDAF